MMPSYTVHITLPRVRSMPGTARWDDQTYADPNEALEVARDAYESRERRRDVLVLDQYGRRWDWFKAEPAPTHPLVGDDRPVHFTRAEVRHMLALLTPAVGDLADAWDMLAERLADTDRMLAAWDGTTTEETGR